MARKSRKAARGRHNHKKLRKINDKLFANGIAAQSSLTQATPVYKQLLTKLREEEKKKVKPV